MFGGIEYLSMSTNRSETITQGGSTDDTAVGTLEILTNWRSCCDKPRSSSIASSMPTSS